MLLTEFGLPDITGCCFDKSLLVEFCTYKEKDRIKVSRESTCQRFAFTHLHRSLRSAVLVGKGVIRVGIMEGRIKRLDIKKEVEKGLRKGLTNNGSSIKKDRRERKKEKRKRRKKGKGKRISTPLRFQPRQVFQPYNE
jgi:hypothetical protein